MYKNHLVYVVDTINGKADDFKSMICTAYNMSFFTNSYSPYSPYTAEYGSVKTRFFK